jgi:ketosteroid isomerase-like protein
MNRIAIGLLFAALAAGPAIAAEKDDVMLPIRQFVDGFNKGDVKSAVAACAEQTSIIDEFPPHEWHGAGACQTWAHDFDADAKKNGITEPMVTISKATRVERSGDQAYIVVPAVYTFKLKGAAMREAAQMTVVLRKGPTGWLIHAWTWTGPKPQAAGTAIRHGPAVQK